MPEMTVGDIFGIVSMAFSLLSFRYARSAHKLRALATNMHFHRLLLEWSSRATGAMSRAAHVMVSSEGIGTEELARMRLDALAELSSIIDEGRFLFPNLPADTKKNVLKPLAYQGSRDVVLDPLVATYTMLSEFRPGTTLTDEQRRTVRELQRTFVTEAQRKLNPRELQAALSENAEFSRG